MSDVTLTPEDCWIAVHLLLLGAVLYLLSWYSYPLFHTLSEFYSITIAVCVFILVWNTRQLVQSHYFLFVGTAYLFISMIDLTHTLAYKGMNIFRGYDANLPTQLWIAARYFQGVALLAAPSFLRRRLGVRSVLAVCAGVSLLLLIVIFARLFPTCYVEGLGLTSFKIYSEYIITAIMTGAIWRLVRHRRAFDSDQFRWLFASIALTIASELLFTFYIGLYDLSNQFGHLFKIGAFYSMYRAAIQTSLRRPIDVMFRDMKETERTLRESEKNLAAIINVSLESSFLIDPQGMVMHCNAISAKRLGVEPKDVIGHNIFDFLPPDIASTRRLYIDQSVHTRKAVQFEDIRGDRCFHHHIYPVQNVNGDVSRLAVFGHDVTEYRNAEETLKSQRNLLFAINEALDFFISGRNPQEVYKEMLHLLVKETGSSYGFLDEVLRDREGAPYKLNLAISDISWDDESRRIYENLVARNLRFTDMNNLAGAPVLERHTVIANDARHHHYYRGIPPGHPPLVNYMGIPLFWGEEVIGVAGVANRQDGYTEDVAEGIKPLIQACTAMIWSQRLLSKERENLLKLKESEHNYRTLFETAYDGIFILDRSGFVDCNEEAALMYGLSRKDVIGRSPLDFSPEHQPDGRVSADVTKELFTAVFNGEHQNFEWRSIHADGTPFDVEITLNRVEIGGLFHLLAIVRDITERKRAEEMMRNAAHEWSTSFDAMPDGVSIHDSDHTIVRVNHSLCQLLGKDAEELIGKKCYDIFHGTDNPIAACPIELSRKTRKKEHIEFFDSFLNKWLSVSSSPIFDESGQLKQLVHIIRDITNRKEEEEERAKLQAQLLQFQKMESIGRLAGGIAHDFNNMLGVILGHAEMALEEVDPKKLHADLEEIRKAANRSADLTAQLLAFARKQTVSPRVLDLNETVEGMLKMLRRLIGEDVNLAWLPGANGWPVKMDPSQINQILANLSVNARDAISGVGRVTIETQNVHCDEAYSFDHPGCIPGDYLLLSVSDDGCGMDKETQGKLFEPFFTTKGIGKGTGLGLATVYGIVKQNNGFIDVCSEPGQGATFKIYLPRHIGKVEKAQMEGPREPVVSGHETILVVEDESSLLELSSQILKRQGYRVLAAATPGEAIRVAEDYSGEIHLLMTDVVMPEMNGRDLAKKILSLYPEIKRLFMSGYTADVIAHHGVLDEEVHFLQKPFSRESLTTTIRKALDQK